MEGQNWISEKRKEMKEQATRKKMGGRYSVPQETPKRPRVEVTEQLKRKKAQLKQLNSRGAQMVRKALGKKKETPRDVVTPGIGFFRPASQEEEEDEDDQGRDNAVEDTGDQESPEPKIKKVTLKERRAKAVTKRDRITDVQKKTFKEAFNTDKTRLDKRQLKYDRPQDFLILVKDS
jgi:hypothetical protein